jgi:hypothetical protein
MQAGRLLIRVISRARPAPCRHRRCETVAKLWRNLNRNQPTAINLAGSAFNSFVGLSRPELVGVGCYIALITQRS